MLDIGANNGVVGIQAIKMGIAKRVLAVEPEPVNFDLLRGNVALNDLGCAVQPVQCAVALEETEVTFEFDPHNAGDHRVRAPEIGDGRRSAVGKTLMRGRQPLCDCPQMVL